MHLIFFANISQKYIESPIPTKYTFLASFIWLTNLSIILLSKMSKVFLIVSGINSRFLKVSPFNSPVFPSSSARNENFKSEKPL